MNRIVWCLIPTKCERCRRPLWLVRAVERRSPIPVCVALETKP